MAEATSPFDGVVDMRDRQQDEGAQNYLLERTILQPFSFMDAHQDRRGLTRTPGLDVATIVLRHLYAKVSSGWRGSPGQDTFTEYAAEEATNPLLKFIWTEFEESDPGALSRSRYHILQVLFPGVNFGESEMSFESIMEHDAMHRTLWKRRPFMLYHPTALRLVEGPNQGTWQHVAFEDPVSTAKQSLIEWDGQGRLGDVISQRFGGFVEGDGESANVFLQSNSPTIIRVKFSPLRQGMVTHDDLWQIQVVPNRLVHEWGGNWRLDKSIRNTYNLIAAVRLRDGIEKSDLMRLWHITGTPILLPSRTANLTGVRWLLSDRADFMLYYAFAPPRDLDGYEPLTLAHKAPFATSHFAAMKATVDGESSQAKGRSGLGSGSTSQKR